MDEAACWEVAWEGLLEVIWDGGVAGRDETWEGRIMHGMGLLDAMWCALLGSDQSAHDMGLLDEMWNAGS